MSITIPTTGIGDTTPAVATELIGGVHYQLLKLYTGTTGAAGIWDGGITTGNVSAFVNNWTTATYVTTGSLMVGQLTTARSLTGTPSFNLSQIAGATVVVSGGSEATALRVTLANDSTGILAGLTTANVSAQVRSVTTGSIMVGQLTTARSLSTGSISAVVANWPASQVVTGYVVITTGQVHIPNVVNVTGSLSASFATTAFQVTTGNINIGNIVSVTGTFAATFATTAFQVTTGVIDIGNVVSVTGTLGATFATTAFQVTTGAIMVGHLTTAVCLSTGTLMVWPLTTARSVISLTTGNISADVRNVTTGNVVVRNLVAGTLTTGNISADVRNVTTGNVSATIAGDVVTRGRGRTFQVTLVTTTGVYTVGDVVGGLITITEAARTTGGNAIVNSITLAAVNAQPYELWLINADLAGAAVADNGVMVWAAADHAKFQGIIDVLASDYRAPVAAFNLASVNGIGRQVKTTSTPSLYAYLKAMTTAGPGTTATVLGISLEYLD